MRNAFPSASGDLKEELEKGKKKWDQQIGSAVSVSGTWRRRRGLISSPSCPALTRWAAAAGRASPAPPGSSTGCPRALRRGAPDPRTYTSTYMYVKEFHPVSSLLLLLKKGLNFPSSPLVLAEQLLYLRPVAGIAILDEGERLVRDLFRLLEELPKR